MRLGSKRNGKPTGLARTEGRRSAKGIRITLEPGASVPNSNTQRRPPGIRLVNPARPSAQATASLKRRPSPTRSSSRPRQAERSSGGENRGDRQLMKPPPASITVPSNTSPPGPMRQLPWLRPPITVSLRACHPLKPSPLAIGITAPGPQPLPGQSGSALRRWGARALRACAPGPPGDRANA